MNGALVYLLPDPTTSAATPDWIVNQNLLERSSMLLLLESQLTDVSLVLGSMAIIFRSQRTHVISNSVGIQVYINSADDHSVVPRRM